MARKTQDQYSGPSVSSLWQVMVSSVLSIGQNMYQSIADVTYPSAGLGCLCTGKRKPFMKPCQTWKQKLLTVIGSLDGVKSYVSENTLL